jgi:hypothetical protein
LGGFIRLVGVTYRSLDGWVGFEGVNYYLILHGVIYGHT